MRRILRNILWSSLFLASLACFSLPASSGQQARNDVPKEFVQKKNPVAALTEDDLRYYAKQYKAKCSRCHGEDGRGGGENAKDQAVPPRDFTDAPFMATRTDGQLFYQILVGGGERSAMPAYGPTSDHAWSEDKVWHMVTFIRRFAAPASQ